MSIGFKNHDKLSECLSLWKHQEAAQERQLAASQAAAEESSKTEMLNKVVAETAQKPFMALRRNSADDTDNVGRRAGGEES